MHWHVSAHVGRYHAVGLPVGTVAPLPSAVADLAGLFKGGGQRCFHDVFCFGAMGKRYVAGGFQLANRHDLERRWCHVPVGQAEQKT